MAEDWRTYETASQAYAQGRATYPDVAVDQLVRRLDLQPGARVADVGAGTGIFSQQLAERGLEVRAIEPVEAMRNEIPGSHRLHPRAGRAEQTGLPDQSVAAVFAATAWHWFNAQDASAEARRILRTGGGIGLIWTGYDHDVPWAHEIAEISTRRRPATSPSAHGGQWRREFDALPGRKPLQKELIRSGWRTTRAGLRQRLRSSSAIARLPQYEQAAAEVELDAILDAECLDEGPFDVPYLTEIYWTFPTKN